MNNRDKGLVLVLVGGMFLMLSFLLPSPTVLWGTLLGTSIVSNIVGTGFIMKFLQEEKSRSCKLT